MQRFDLSWKRVQLPLKHTFTISRGSKYHANNVILRMLADDITAFGEAAPNPRYNESPESVVAFFEKLDLSHVPNIFDVRSVMEEVIAVDEQEHSAHAAVEMALCDWIGKKLDIPLYRLWNAPSSTGPQSSVTLGLGSPDELEQKIKEVERYPILKVKLGSGKDRDIIRQIRKHTDKTLWVDANEGWTDFQQASDMTLFLADQGVQLIEQPMPASAIEDIAKLKEISPVPIFADEGFTGTESLEDIAAAYHGINIKLMKIGGMTPALRTIARARQYGMKVMIGCMLETSLANTAGAVVSMFADYADLDGSFLLAEDPFNGFTFTNEAFVKLNEEAGLGVSPDKSIVNDYLEF
ncbi:MAG TPA: dipeptide epimerase [Balneolales bacterium]|nr:dipeptide epimerase [Balneolales bacterium]